MRVLLIGAGGMLGKDILRTWQGIDIIPVARQDADIRDLQEVRSLIQKHHPDWVLLAAAFTDVDGAERNPGVAFAINEHGTANVAQASEEVGARLLFISTDYVFDGTYRRPYEPEDPISPLGVYGDSKAKGEAAVQRLCSRFCIVRTSWLFGAQRSSFPEKILQAAISGLELRVVSDQVGSPTYTKDLALALQQLIKAEARGILNFTNAGTCSWFEFAEEILRQAGLKTPVHPITTAEAARLARRPAYSVLSPATLGAYGITPRSWQEALGAYLDDLRQQGKLH